jgi:thymidylate synthase
MHYDEKGLLSLKELLNLTVIVGSEDSDNTEVPSFMNLTKKDTTVYIDNFFKKSRKVDDYNYGERLFNYDGFDQVERMTEKLKKFPQDKGALCVLWKPKEDSFPRYKSTRPKHVPCLTSIQCQVWEKKLFMTAYFRSNDMGSAWPLNAFALRSLQSKVAKELKVDLGTLTTISNMAHLYERDYEMAEQIVKKHGKQLDCQFDPRGNLVITVEKGIIKVVQIAPDGNTVLNRWNEDGSKLNSARVLSDKIVLDMSVSQVPHALYIGRQLAWAEEAVRRGLRFVQDQPLPLD